MSDCQEEGVGVETEEDAEYTSEELHDADPSCVYKYVARTLEEDRGALKHPELFLNVSNHDSCWSDLRLSNTYFQLCDEVKNPNNAVPVEEQKVPATTNMFNLLRHTLFIPVFSFVKVEIQRTFGEYHNKVTSIEVIKHQPTIGLQLTPC